MLSGIEWRYPEFFIVIVAVWLFWLMKLSRGASQTHGISLSAVFLGKAPGSSRTIKIWLLRSLPVLYMLALTLLGVSLARPLKVETKVQRRVEGIDIVITLDISDSMLIEDMKPENRLEAAKQVLIDFVKGRTNDRIGVVIFAGEAFTLIPPTLDYELIQTRVSELTTAKDARIKDGTALGVALAATAARLQKSKASSKVAIFLTDGENNTGTIDPETGLEVIKSLGIRVYAIALGKSGPTRIPIYSRDAFGNRIKSYQPFTSTVNEEFLSRVASETGGKFFPAPHESALRKVFQDIDRLEKTSIDTEEFKRFDELFMYPLQWGYWLLLVTLILDRLILRRYPAW